MGLINETNRQYYNLTQLFTGTGVQTDFTLTFDPLPASEADFTLFIDGVEQVSSTYVFPKAGTSDVLEIPSAPADSAEIKVVLGTSSYGKYQFTSMKDIVRNFMIQYVGDGKLISRGNRRDVVFHAKRAIQEFSYDISRVEKILEVEIGTSLTIPFPQDYVNYVALSWVDSSGIEHPIPNGRLTSRPSSAPLQDSLGGYFFDDDDSLLESTPVTNQRFKELKDEAGDYLLDPNYNIDRVFKTGSRYGGEPELMNDNGMFVIDQKNGNFAFSSNLVGVIVNIKYVSDGLGTDDEMKVHKLAEEAIYKHIAFMMVSTMANVPEYIVNRFRKEKRAAMRNAKLRLQNYKLAELTNVMRGKSKHLKH